MNILGDMDNAIPVPLSRHFYVEYSKVNPNVMYLELPRSGHTATSKFYRRKEKKAKVENCFETKMRHQWKMKKQIVVG